jgi:hypothetical protein
MMRVELVVGVGAVAVVGVGVGQLALLPLRQQAMGTDWDTICIKTKSTIMKEFTLKQQLAC